MGEMENADEAQEAAMFAVTTAAKRVGTRSASATEGVGSGGTY